MTPPFGGDIPRDPPSPVVAAGAQVAFTITVEERALDVTIQVARIETWSSVNRVPRARLVMYDGSATAGTFPLSASNTFYPGYEVEVAAAYNNQAEMPIFQGIVVRQGVEIAEHGSPRLVVELRDRAVGMTLRRKNAVFTDTKDSVLMHQLIRAYQLTGEVADTPVTHPQVVQYYASDWDMMVMRAEVNGFVVLADRGTVRVGPPDTQQRPVLTVNFGESVMGLQAEMDAASQLSSSAIHSRAWDPSTQTVLDGRPFAFAFEEPGDIPSETLATKLDVETFGQQSGGMLEVASLEGWSSAELFKSKLSKIRGWVRFQGSALAKPGTVVKLGGLGGRFDGGMWVSGVHHVIAEGSWLTTAEFGLSPRWYAEERPDIAAPPAAAQLPPVSGLQTGVVRAVATDPGGGFRVQVNLPLLGDVAPALVWARLATFYASKGFGALFYPEPGDEVVVGFMNDDPRFPVVLGSVYSANRAPPAAPAEKNDIKELITRGKLTLRFDDANAVLEIRTPKSRICLDDRADEVRVEDGNGNHVTLAKGGITVESASDLTLKAAGNVSVQAGGNLSLGATGDVSVEGLNVSARAQANLSATGSAAELKGSASVVVKGAVVMIN
jgi:Rhs element Vgr protein